MSAPAICVVDYGMGNIRSVEKALEHVGAAVTVTRDPERIRRAAGVVLPGVGAFPKAMQAIDRLGLRGTLVERVAARAPTLGICLGMELLFERSSELGGADGLGLLRGHVEPLAAAELKLPQIGWNPVTWLRHDEILDRLPQPCALYHVHSFAVVPDERDVVLGTADYGADFVTAVARPPLYGVQFHPEKSGPAGLRLLGNFARIAARELQPTP